MPRYYNPDMSGEIRPGTRETSAIGAGPKTAKRGEFIPRAELATDNGRKVSTTVKTLHVHGMVLTNVRVWDVCNGYGDVLATFPYRERAAAERAAAGAVPPGFVTGRTTAV